MTGNKHNPDENSNDRGEPDPGPYWRRMHRDWRFWVGALFMGGARDLRPERGFGMGSMDSIALAVAGGCHEIIQILKRVGAE